MSNYFKWMNRKQSNSRRFRSFLLPCLREWSTFHSSVEAWSEHNKQLSSTLSLNEVGISHPRRWVELQSTRRRNQKATIWWWEWCFGLSLISCMNEHRSLYLECGWRRTTLQKIFWLLWQNWETKIWRERFLLRQKWVTLCQNNNFPNLILKAWIIALWIF